MNYKFFSDCVGWPGKVNTLTEMIDDATDITRRTFREHVDHSELADMENMLGYAKHSRQGLTMAGDWHVTYHKSKLKGTTVYYFCQSAIEYVFAPDGFTLRRTCNV